MQNASNYNHVIKLAKKWKRTQNEWHRYELIDRWEELSPESQKKASKEINSFIQSWPID